MHQAMLRSPMITVILLLSACMALVVPCRAQNDSAALADVAKAILAWDGSSPGDLFKAVKAANPNKAAIVSMRELNKALADKKMPAEIAGQAEAIKQKQKTAQAAVREQVLASRRNSYAQFRANNKSQSRSIYGQGDIGSWPTAAEPDASMDVDYTVFGVDPEATANLRDQCKRDLLNDLVGENSGLTLADFDIVVTAEGHEAAAGVFETEGGIDWAKRNMKRVTITNMDGTSRTYELGKGGDPIREMAYAEHMAKFRELASKNGDYEKIFDEKGFIREKFFDSPERKTPMEAEAAKAMWDKYMDMLSSFGVDFYVSRTDTATGGCLDMAKHLNEEVLTKKFEPKSKLKKTLKYVSRANNISRGAGLEKLMAADPILSDPAYKDVVDLAREVTAAGSDDARLNEILKERFGDMPDAGLQELGNKARRTILRMAELSYQVEMDRIVLEISDPSARQAALDKLAGDMKIIADEGGDYSDLARTATEHINKMSEANKSGAIDEIRKNYTSLEKIRQANRGVIDHAKEFLNETPLGKKMLEVGGKLLEVGNTKIMAPAEGQFRSSAAEFVGEMVDTARTRSLKIVEVAGSITMWAEVVDNVRTAKSDAELAIALGKTLVNNTFFGMVLNTAYAGVVQGDNNALAKAVMYMLVPETALPALVESLGNTAINVGAQTLFDAQMQKVYEATTFNKDGKISDFSGLGEDGPTGAKLFVDTMCDGAPEMVAQDLISKSKATDFGSGSNAIAIKAIAKSIRSTVDNGNPLIFKEDGPLMKACAGIRKCTEDISDCAKAWGVEVALSASNKNDLPSGLDIGQTRAMEKLMAQREKSRLEARAALADAMVRTFEERHRAEKSLEEGKAKEEYEALLKIFEQLGISAEGQKSLDAEGAPYNIITNWTTSTKEKQITAVKAVQKFSDAYGFVLQSRAKAESVAREAISDSYNPDPRPLTNSLPLTANPDLDVQIAKAYLAEVAPITENTIRSLELIKKAGLDGDYDDSMFSKLYEVRFKIAYWNAMMKAASDAQQLHWTIEIFDKQALYNKHSEAAAKVSELRKQEDDVQEEFRKHYQVEGDFVVALTGPEQLQSGQEAELTASVKVRTKSGDLGPVSEDVAKQFVYAWSSGKVDLGQDSKSSRKYKLETVGEHTFKVVVKRVTSEGGKQKTDTLGMSEHTVKVVPESGIKARIDGKNAAKPNDNVELNAVVETDKPPLPELKYAWTGPAGSLGDKQTAVFVSKAEGAFDVKLDVSAQVNGKWSVVASDVKKIKISKTLDVSVAVQGAKESLPGVKTTLKAVVTADSTIKNTLRCIWKEGDTRLGEGESIDYSSPDEKTHKITVVVLRKADGAESEAARADHEIKVAKQEDKPAGYVTASLDGIKPEVVKGGSVQIWPGAFKNGDETLVTVESDEIIPYLQMKWAAYYKSTHKGEDLSDPRSIPDRPKGWGLDKFKVIWKSSPAGGFAPAETINNDKTSFVAGFEPETEVTVWGEIRQEKDGKFVPVGQTEKGRFKVGKELISVRLEATKTSLKPGEVADVLAAVTGYGAQPPFTFQWTGDYAAASKDMSKVSFASRKGGDYVLSCEVTDSKGQKGSASITLSVVSVTATINGIKEHVTYGDILPLSVKIEGLDKLKQTSSGKKDEKEKNEDWVLTAIEKDDVEPPQYFLDFKVIGDYGNTSFHGLCPFPDHPIDVTANWAMPPQRVKPGNEVQIPWSIDGHGTELGDGAGHLSIGLEADYNNQIYVSLIKKENQGYGTTSPVSDDKGNPVDCSHGTWKMKFPEGLPGKQIKIVVHAEAEYEADGSRTFAEMKRTFVYTFAGENPVDVQQGVKVIWQSEPGITFTPGASMDQKTNARFDRMGDVKVWAEIQVEKEGVYQTVGETDQSVVNVGSPKFKITFTPPEGQAKVGQEVKAVISKADDPQLNPEIVDYAWTNPASANRLELDKNASSISFKLKDSNPVELFATAKSPHYADVIGEIKGSYTASAYTVKADVIGTAGPKPQIWKEGVGLVEVEKGTYAADENVTVKATIEGDPAPNDVRWKWTANEGTTIVGGETSQEARFSRHETGSAECSVEARDKDGILLGKANTSFSVTVSADEIKKAKDMAAKIELSLKADKTSAKLGDTVKFTASAKGGKSPYTYSWTGDATGKGATATLKADEVGQQQATVTVTDANGKTASKSVTVNVAGAFAVDVSADKKEMFVGETAAVKASAKGGKAPYAFKWYGTGVTGKGQSASVTPTTPGNADVTVVVTDAKKRSAKQTLSIKVQGIEAAIEGLPDQAMLGSKVAVKVSLGQSQAANALPLTVAWHSDPAIHMQTTQSSDKNNTLTFDRQGRISVWAELLDKSGKSLAKTEPKSVEVGTPHFELSFEKQGASVLAKLSTSDKVDLSKLEFKWMRPSEATVAADGTSATFKPTGSLPTDILVRIKIRETLDLVQEVKSQYEAQDDKKETKGKDGKPTAEPDKTSTGDKEPDNPRAAAEAATKKINQARTLAANGKIDEAVKMVDEAAKVVPAEAEAARKSISRDASAWSGNAVTDLDFEKANHLAELGVKLDPDSDEAKQKQAEVKKWSDAWDRSSKLRPEFDKLLAANKVPSAEKIYLEVNDLLGPIPAAPKTHPILNDMMERWVKARDVQTLAIQPHRRQIMQFIKENAHENALPLINEVLDGKVVAELYPAQEKEFKDWQAQCEAAIKARKAAAAKSASKTPATAKTSTSTSKTTKAGTKRKSLDDVLTDISGKLDKINNTLGADKPKEPSKPTVLVEVGNTAGCQLTDTARFTLKSAAKVTQIIIWASWENNENSIGYKLYDMSGQTVYSGTFARGQSDTYQKNWCNGVDEPDLTLQAGTYSVRVPKQMIGQNSGTGGNGMIKVVTGGLLVPAGSASKTPAKQDTAPTKAVTKPVKQATPVKTVTKPANAPEDVPLKPVSSDGNPGPGWSLKKVGIISVYVPSSWATVPASESQGAWYTGDMDEPDAGFGIIREQATMQELTEDVTIHSQSDIKVSGLAAKSYIGKPKKDDLVGWLVQVTSPPDGKPMFFIGVAKTAKWGTNRAILEKILGTVRIGGTSKKASSAPATSKPKATSGPKMIEAIVTNQANQNVHIFTEGGRCDPSNRVTPGETKRFLVQMPANGRITFCAGRNGQVLTKKNWDGDPDDTNRLPRVTFSSSEALLVTTSLK